MAHETDISLRMNCLHLFLEQRCFFCASSTLGIIQCCYISQTWWWGDLEAVGQLCLKFIMERRRRWTGCRVCFLILSNTFVYSCFSRTALFIWYNEYLQCVFLVANSRSLGEFTPFPQYLTPMFSSFSFAQHMFCHKTLVKKQKEYLLLILFLILKSQVLVYLWLQVDQSGFVPTHIDEWICSSVIRVCYLSLFTPQREGIHWCSAISITESETLSPLTASIAGFPAHITDTSASYLFS